MATAPARTNSQPAQTRPATEQHKTPLLDAMLDKEVEYIPFLAKSTIKLSVNLVLKFLCRPTKTGKLCDAVQATRFIMLCKSRGLNPWEGDAYIVGYDTKDGPEFSLITAHQAFLKRAEIHPEYDGLESGVIVKRDGHPGTLEIPGDFADDGDELVGGWCKVYFKNRAHPMHKRIRLSVFKKNYGRWAIDPAGMGVKVAEADALRSAFPNSLGGMYLDDELPAIVEAAEQHTTAPLPVGRVDLRRNGKTPQPVTTPPEERVSPIAETQQDAPADTTPTAKPTAPKKVSKTLLKMINAQIDEFKISDERLLKALAELNITTHADGSALPPVSLEHLSEADVGRLIDLFAGAPAQ